MRSTKPNDDVTGVVGLVIREVLTVRLGVRLGLVLGVRVPVGVVVVAVPEPPRHCARTDKGHSAVVQRTRRKVAGHATNLSGSRA
jgi:hypothetical protein